MMNGARGSSWWAQIERALVYGALLIACLGIGVFTSLAMNRPLLGQIVAILSWIIGAFVMDVRVSMDPKTEEEIE